MRGFFLVVGRCDPYKLLYDGENRCVCSITLEKNVEVSRSEYTYDEHGNLETTTNFLSGEQDARTAYTYKEVTISREKAEQLPQFVRAK